MSSSQLSWSTSSYARKYCLAWLFVLDSNDWIDADATNTHWKEEKVEKKSEPKENPNWRFKKAIESKKFMQSCLDEDDFIKKIKDKYTVDEIQESQLREAYKMANWIDDGPVDLPFWD